LNERDLELSDGRRLHIYDTRADDPWGFDPSRVRLPVLIVQGGQDRIAPRSHGMWLAQRIHSAELWLRPEDGHISVLSSAEAAMDWLLERSGRPG
jgi:pimeloyl-ACP methyl ester carboxylesterase